MVVKKGKPARAASGKDSTDQQAAPKEGKPNKKEKKPKSRKDTYSGDDLHIQLASLGLRIKSITGDGNCFFRALGDQIEGNEGLHGTLRAKVVEFMREHQDEYAPFVEDDEGWDKYIARMKKDGTWAGYMEVIAASRALEANFSIYQAGTPLWVVKHSDKPDVPTLHLAYDGQHYDSVRMADDYGTGPPKPVQLTGPGLVPVPTKGASNGRWSEKDEEQIRRNTCCSDLALIRKALEQTHGDIDAAIEQVITWLAEQPDTRHDAELQAAVGDGGNTHPLQRHAQEDEAAQPAQVAMRLQPSSHSPEQQQATLPPSSPPRRHRSSTVDKEEHQEAGAQHASVPDPGSVLTDPKEAAQACSGGTTQTTGSQQSEVSSAAAAPQGTPAAAHRPGVRGTKVKTRPGGPTARADKPPGRNQPCPCGSRKKYKACCGAAAAAQARRKATAVGADDGGEVGQDDTPQRVITAAQLEAIIL